MVDYLRQEDLLDLLIGIFGVNGIMKDPYINASKMGYE
jgi:hypothetical protein